MARKVTIKSVVLSKWGAAPSTVFFSLTYMENGDIGDYEYKCIFQYVSNIITIFNTIPAVFLLSVLFLGHQNSFNCHTINMFNSSNLLANR